MNDLAPESAAIVKLDEARRALAEMRDVDEVKDVRDKAEAMRIYARQAHLGLEAQNHAAEIKLRAERRVGQLLEELKPGGNGSNQHKQSSHDERIAKKPTLEELGISYSQSSRWQAIAALPESEFEKRLDAIKDADKEITTAAMLRFAEALKGASPEVQYIAATYDVDDPDTVRELRRLQKDAPDTFEEVRHSGFVQPGEEAEAVHVSAGYKAFKTATDLKSKIHKQVARDVKIQARIQQLEQTEVENTDYRVITGDLSLLCDELPDNSVDLFFTDPPYHADKPYLYGQLAALAAAKLKPGGLCLAYSGHMHLPQVFIEMAQHLTYWWTFAIRHTGGHLTIWDRHLWNDWKPVVVFAKLQADGKKPAAPEWIQDFVDGGGRDKEHHTWGQDASEATYWIDKLTQPGALICDPFVGGGAIGAACKATKRRYIGTEIDAKQADIARVRLMEMVA